MMEKFRVDRDGWLWHRDVRMGVNCFHVSDANLLAGRFEKTGFGMSALEREAATYLGLLKVK